MHHRHDRTDRSRRVFLRDATVGSLVVLSGCAGRADRSRNRPPQPSGGEGEEGVSAAEDLMREHGVLDRLLLVYEESRRRLTRGGPVEAPVLHRAAGLMRSFVEQYHERLEEEHLFPRFEKAGRLVDLVRVLAAQHRAGREVTDVVLRQTGSGVAAADPDALVGAIDAFLRMYRPHSAREDTVLFPALHALVDPAELAELGERFEEIEHRSFGAGGFENVVAEVADLERALEIHELAKFTPKIE